MLFPVEWLKEYTTKFPKNLEELTDRLAMTGFMLDKPIEEVEGMQVMDLEFRRNRPDAEGMIGMAREITAAFGGNLKNPPVERFGELPEMTECALQIEAKDLVNRFYALHIKVEPGNTPEWMMKRLRAYGMEASGNVLIDITNYVMLETGQPLHAFDLDRIDRALDVRLAKEDEKLVVIGNKEVELDESDLVIAGKENPLAIAGVIGEEESGIQNDTTEIILEAANYDRVSVRLTSRRHNLHTEASDRLQKDHDPNVADLALMRAVYLFKAHANAELIAGTDYYPDPVSPIAISFKPEEVERYAGVKVPEREMIEILERLGLQVAEGKPWKVTIPTFRTDVKQDVDIIEEILRIWGYEKIPEINMATPIPDPIHIPEYELEDEVRDILIAMGLDELITIAALPMDELKDSYKNPKHKDLKRAVKIETPPTEYFEYLRTNMFPTILSSVKTKMDLGESNVSVFEVGRIYFEDNAVKDDVPYREPRRVAGILTGINDWYDAKGIITELLNKLGVRFEWKDGEHPVFADGTTLEAIANKKTVARIGELEGKFHAFEIDVDELAKCDRKTKDMSRWSEYPQVLRDISVIIDKDIKSGEIVEVIEKTGGDILYSVVPTDVYKGDKIPGGKKNIVFALTYWSKVKTLTAEEVDEVYGKIGDSLEKKLNAEISGR